MSDLVDRAIRFATEAHQRIEHRRKYSGQSYTVHLREVARIVESVTDDPEMIAAAWLHDVVEDTPATLGDVEREFGRSVRALVRELTDVSHPGDGNRAARKRLDREHLAKASHRAQTIKVADLIDNCNDITRHDPRFGRVYLDEMAALLEVLTGADEALLRRARKAHGKGEARVARAAGAGSAGGEGSRIAVDGHFRARFNELFSVEDLAEPLLSFDGSTPAKAVGEALAAAGVEVASIRDAGKVRGFVRRDDLAGRGACARVMREFEPTQVLDGGAGLAEAVHVLTLFDHAFVRLVGEVQGVVRRDDVNKPYMRMWLFGIITLMEMRATRLIRERFPDDGWQALLPPSRLEVARGLQRDRARINQPCELVDCLQFADKGAVLVSDPEILELLGFDSRSAAKRVMKEFQSLRNNLAHAQDISTWDWAQLARLSRRMLETDPS